MKTRFTELIQREKPTLVDFSASWCGPCKMMTPVLEELKSSVGERATVIKIDIDRNPRAASEYKVKNVPTLMLFKKGRIVWRDSGVIPSAFLKRIIDLHGKLN